ncbi:MAG: helix-turn-helix transcriptional regulator [Sphaerochaeta sp.]|jgi:AraC-like DNA-binding protein|uniref:AraC family transcriptional regulator n=1 Tax=Sphaerochaeta sp. TaxID=1972642 RepID=UPI003D115C63
MRHSLSELLFDPSLVITVNRVDDPVFYVFDYQKRRLNMEFQHFHTYWEVYILFDDTAGHVIEGEYFSLQRGDLVLLKPGLLHKSTYEEHAKPKARLVIGFRIEEHPKGFERQTERLLSLFGEKIPIFRFDGQIQEEIHRLLNRIYQLGTEQPANAEMMIHQSFMELLWVLYTHKRQNQYVKQASTNSVSEKIYAITSYMHIHFDERLTLPEIAKMFSISPYYLSRQFKLVTGAGFVTYLQMIRIRHAQNDLLYSKKPIQQICEESGFPSFSQFNRVFHQYCEMSPSAFRKDTDHRSQLLLRRSDPEHNTKATLPRILQSPEEQG